MLAKTIPKELSLILHPREVKKIRMDGHSVSEDVLRTTNVYIVLYFALFFISIFLISFDEFDFTTNFTAVTATFNNIGPGLNMVGPTKNFAQYSNFSKIVLMFDMLAGRLEIYPMVVMLFPSTWRRK